MIVAFFVTVILVLILSPSSLDFTGRLIAGIDRNLFGLLLALIVIGIVNAIDDFKGLGWPIKLAAQVVAALIIIGFGILIPTLSNPFGSQVVVSSLSWALVVIWLIVIINVINWLDSINGVAGGVSSITLIVLFLLSIDVTVNQSANALLAIIGLGVTIGFLIFNLRGKVFMGDTGSMFLGLLIGVLAIISGGKVATVFLVLAIPFLDALVVFATRLLSHQSPFLADRRHLIHRLMDRGMTKWQIIGLFYSVSIVFGYVALHTQTLGKFWAVLAAMALMSIFILLYSSQKPILNKDE